MCINLNLNFGV